MAAEDASTLVQGDPQILNQFDCPFFADLQTSLTMSAG
jgi:hypothetical protein